MSANYTCHIWLPDGRMLVCNDTGDILVLESGGEYKFKLHEAPSNGYRIENIITYSKGIVISGENGTMLIYEKSEDIKNPYLLVAKLPQNNGSIIYDDSNIKRTGALNPKLLNAVMKSRINSMCMNSSENTLVFTTSNNQIMKAAINIERRCEDSKYEFLIYPFHSSTINGLDVCLKR